MEYWISSGSEAKGPYTRGQLISMWSAGHLTSDTHYFDPVRAAWQRLRDLVELPHQPQTTPEQQRLANLLRSLDVKETPARQSPQADTLADTPPQTDGWNLAGCFSPLGRWSRGRFLGGVLLYSIMLMGLYGLCMSVDPEAARDSADLHAPEVIPMLISLSGLLYAYLMLCAAVKRMRDMGWSLWGLPLLALGLTWLMLLIVPSKKE